MDLKHLHTFKKIIEEGSFQKAAQKLNYAPSTISFQMKQLENELSMCLFKKNGSKMELTEDGKKLLPLIDKMLETSEELLHSKKESQELTGTLKIGIAESLATYKLPPILKKFNDQAPQVKLSLQTMNCHIIHDKIINGNLDLGIQYIVGDYPKEIYYKSLFTSPVSLVASPLLTNEQSDFITPNQRKKICNIQNDSRAIYLDSFNQYLKEKNIILEQEIEIWSIETLKESIKKNLGISVLPSFTVENELKEGSLKELKTEMSITLHAIYAYNKKVPLKASTKLFLRLLNEISM